MPRDKSVIAGRFQSTVVRIISAVCGRLRNVWKLERVAFSGGVFMNALLDGSGPWTSIPAPVEVPISYDNPCPNYSSALMPVENGAALLEFASDFYALNKCGMYFATKPWTEMISNAPRTSP